MANTLKGIWFPTSDEQITPLETVFADLAATADKAGVLSGAQLFTGPAATDGTVSVIVTFAEELDVAPRVIASVQGGSGASVYAVTITGAPTTTGFSAKVLRLNGTTAETNLYLTWYASTQGVSA